MATAPISTALRQVQRLFVEGSTANVPDGELLERFLSEGDEAAFTALIERHGPMVLGTCRAMLGDRDGRGGCLPGDVPGADLQGAIDPGPRRPGELALSGGASDRPPGRHPSGPQAVA